MQTNEQQPPLSEWTKEAIEQLYQDLLAHAKGLEAMNPAEMTSEQQQERERLLQQAFDLLDTLATEQLKRSTQQLQEAKEDLAAFVERVKLEPAAEEEGCVPV